MCTARNRFEGERCVPWVSCFYISMKYYRSLFQSQPYVSNNYKVTYRDKWYIMCILFLRSELKLKTIHKYFKRQLHCIQISTNICEVTMQVKRAIGKATLHKLPIFNEYMCLCLVNPLFCMICCLFSNCSKSSNKRLRSLYVTFSLCFKYSTFSCARTPRNGA